MYPIHCSQERYEKEYPYPKGVVVKNIPNNGTPFSGYTLLSIEDTDLKVQFGPGGYYPDTACLYIADFFKSKNLEKLENSYQRVESKYAEGRANGREHPEDHLMFFFGMLVDGIDKLLVLEFLKEKNPTSPVTASYSCKKRGYLTLAEKLGENWGFNF